MILLLLSLFFYNTNIQTFMKDSIYTNDINFSIKEQKGWFFGELEGGIRFDFTPSRMGIGFSDLLLEGGVKRNIRVVDLSLSPLFHYPGSSKKSPVRNFSINDYGYGVGIGLDSKLLGSKLGADFKFMEYTTSPNISSTSFGTQIKFNPDTLTFGLDFSFRRFTLSRYSSISYFYITPNITLSKWRKLALNFGIDFRVSGGVDTILELDKVGVNTGDYGIPPWRVLFGISSPERLEVEKSLIPLRIILLKEGAPANGLLSLADSGSFEVKGGEIDFELPEGIYPISVYAEDCIPADTTIILKKETELLLYLRRKETLGMVEGEVLDAETHKPLAAEISIVNSKRTVVLTNPETGRYKTFLPPGDYIFRVTSKSYYPRTSLIEVIAEKVSRLNFDLLPAGGKE